MYADLPYEFYKSGNFSVAFVRAGDVVVVELRGRQGECIMQLTFDELVEIANEAKKVVLFSTMQDAQ